MMIITKLAFLAGCWVSQDGTNTTYERWNAPTGGVMLGNSQSVSNGQTAFFEFLKISEENGQVLYTPYVNGLAKPPFTLVSATDGAVTFTSQTDPNLRRISYTKNDAGLFVQLDFVGNDGTPKPVSYTMTESTCP